VVLSTLVVSGLFTPSAISVRNFCAAVWKSISLCSAIQPAQYNPHCNRCAQLAAQQVSVCVLGAIQPAIGSSISIRAAIQPALYWTKCVREPHMTAIGQSVGVWPAIQPTKYEPHGYWSAVIAVV